MKTLFLYISLLLLFVSHSCSEDTVALTQKGSVKGKVIKKGTNEPIPNVKITTSPSTETVISGADGTFIIENIPIGDYSVKAELTGYVATFEGINIKKSDQVVSVLFELSDDNSLNSPPSTPTLLSPTDASVNQPTSVTLTWNAIDPDKKDSLTYRLLVKTSINTNVLEVKDIKEKNYNLTNLVFGASYFWQVGVSDGINKEVLSPVFSFKVSANPNNRFHFARKMNGNYYIISSNDQGQSFQFTDPSVNSFRPRLNNNANLIAFLRTVDGNNQIFTANRDGSNVKQVTTYPVTGFNMKELDYSWNPSGSQFIYPSFDKLYKINKDGSGLTLVYQTPDGSFISECEWSYDSSKIAIKTNNVLGYGVKIQIIDMVGSVMKTILSGVTGGAGGLNFSIDGNSLLYTRDFSGYEDSSYRQLDSRIFLINLTTNVIQDISALSQKPAGTNDLDPRFAPNDADIIFTNTSNDQISPSNIVKVTLNFSNNNSSTNRTVLFSNAEMADWE